MGYPEITICAVLILLLYGQGFLSRYEEGSLNFYTWIALIIAVGYFFIAFVANNQSLLN